MLFAELEAKVCCLIAKGHTHWNARGVIAHSDVLSGVHETSASYILRHNDTMQVRVTLLLSLRYRHPSTSFRMVPSVVQSQEKQIEDYPTLLET